MIEKSKEIAYRTDFALICNARGYVDAVEVGTDQGLFARDFLSRWHGNWLICVDPYEPCPEFGYDRTPDMMAAVVALSPYLGRYRMLRSRSIDAPPRVLSFIHPPGFVYIDGDHCVDAVKTDLATWWPVLSDGGMLAGHDYDDGHPGVMTAVKEFARDYGLVVRLTHETTCPPSWYVYKGEPDKLVHKFFHDAESKNPRVSR